MNETTFTISFTNTDIVYWVLVGIIPPLVYKLSTLFVALSETKGSYFDIELTEVMVLLFAGLLGPVTWLFLFFGYIFNGICEGSDFVLVRFYINGKRK